MYSFDLAFESNSRANFARLIPAIFNQFETKISRRSFQQWIGRLLLFAFKSIIAILPTEKSRQIQYVP